jgi:hypothetical protein
MHFVYEGFTHHGDVRNFLFSGKDGRDTVDTFCIEVAFLLFSQNRVSLQEGPQFCLQLLETASMGQPSDLDRFHHYSVVSEDFRPLLVEREKKLTERAVKAAARRPLRKPSTRSNLVLGKPSMGR